MVHSAVGAGGAGTRGDWWGDLDAVQGRDLAVLRDLQTGGRIDPANSQFSLPFPKGAVPVTVCPRCPIDLRLRQALTYAGVGRQLAVRTAVITLSI